MPEVFCDTSPLQYLYQLDLLHILPELAGRVIVPAAVQEELAVGRQNGINLPDLRLLDWAEIRRPVSAPALPLVTDLGPGETEVLMLALEAADPLVILDDALARRIAEALELRLTGTLGLLLDAKRAGLVSSVRPCLDRLQELRFRIAPQTRSAVLHKAGETA